MAQVTVKKLSRVDLTHDNLDVINDCGWWDWFCTDEALVNRSRKFVNLAKRLDPEWDKVGVFLKNNCPMVGNTYDSLVLQDSSSDDQYWVENQNGWKVYFIPSNTVVFEGNARGVAKFLNEQKAPK